MKNWIRSLISYLNGFSRDQKIAVAGLFLQLIIGLAAIYIAVLTKSSSENMALRAEFRENRAKCIENTNKAISDTKKMKFSDRIQYAFDLEHDFEYPCQQVGIRYKDLFRKAIKNEKIENSTPNADNKNPVPIPDVREEISNPPKNILPKRQYYKSDIYQEQLDQIERDRQDAESIYSDANSRWKADVAACQAGDTSRCAR